MIGVILASAVVTGVVASNAAKKRRSNAANNPPQKQNPAPKVVYKPTPIKETWDQTPTETRQQRYPKSYTDNLLTKFAICCYIARADGVLTKEENQNLCMVYNDIRNESNDPQFLYELKNIFFRENFNFIFLERYLRNSSTETIATFLELAEEIAQTDSNVSETEQNCLNKLRQYLTDRSGKNYMKESIGKGKEINVMCPGCSANMTINEYERMLTCPFCGNIRYF